MNIKSLPGWTAKIDEISTGVFKATLMDNYGRKVEIVDNASQEAIDRTLNEAFNIEKQISNNWNKFLYDFCLLRLSEDKITKQSYDDKAFGSWLIEATDNRLLYLGRESWLVSQIQSNNNWFDNYIIKDNEVDYKTITLFLKHMK